MLQGDKQTNRVITFMRREQTRLFAGESRRQAHDQSESGEEVVDRKDALQTVAKAWHTKNKTTEYRIIRLATNLKHASNNTKKKVRAAYRNRFLNSDGTSGYYG